MRITNDAIVKDKELFDFLTEEYSKMNIPDYFDCPNYVPTKEEFDSFTKEQKEYLLQSVLVDLNDFYDFEHDAPANDFIYHKLIGKRDTIYNYKKGE